MFHWHLDKGLVGVAALWASPCAITEDLFFIHQAVNERSASVLSADAIAEEGRSEPVTSS